MEALYIVYANTVKPCLFEGNAMSTRFILYGGRIKADFDTIEIHFVGSLLYGQFSQD